jgi:hypothetical protein
MVKPVETEKRMVVSRDWRERNGESLSHECKVLVSQVNSGNLQLNLVPIANNLIS